jgi:hypothetical protein
MLRQIPILDFPLNKVETKYSWAALRCDILGSECWAGQENQQQEAGGARTGRLTGNEPKR